MEILIISPSMLIILILACSSAMTATPTIAKNGQPADATVLEGETAMFHCRFNDSLNTGEKKYTVHWAFLKHDGINLLTKAHDEVHDKDKHIVATISGQESSTLTITNVTISNERSYLCQVREQGKRVLTSEPAHLTVLPKPEFQKMPSTRTIGEGDNVTLHCHIENIDLSHFQVRWFKDEERISVNYVINFTSNSNSSWEIAVLGNNSSGVYDLAIANVQENGNFYCDVYLIASGRVVLKSETATILFRNYWPTGNTQQSHNADKLLQIVIIVAVLVLIVVIVSSITICVDYMINVRRKSGTAVLNVLGKDDIEEHPWNTDTSPGLGDIAEHPERSDIESTTFEKVKSISVPSTVSEESVISQPHDNLAKSKIDDETLTSASDKSSQGGNDGVERKSRNVEGLVYADLDLRLSVGERPLTIVSLIDEEDTSVTYAEVQTSDVTKG